MATSYRSPSHDANLFEDHFSTFLPPSIDDFLHKLDQVIDFASFRPLIIAQLSRDKSSPCIALRRRGRAPFDPIFMLQCLFIQAITHLSDRAFHVMMMADLRLHRFLHLEKATDIPSPKTLWKYRNLFSRLGIFEQLFQLHLEQIRSFYPDLGKLAQIVDSSFVEAPRQRNTRQENRRIAAGQGPQLWRRQPHKRRHKDVDARWTKKRGETHYGYKGHFTVCAASKLILQVFTTPANTHDAAVMADLLRPAQKGALLYADAGYVGQEQERLILRRGLYPLVCEKGFRNNPLTPQQKQRNTELARVRCRIEHVFAFMEKSLGGSYVRCVGIIRTKAEIAMRSLLYNAFRLRFLAQADPG